MSKNTNEFLRAATEYALNGNINNTSLCLQRIAYWSKIEGIDIPQQVISEIRHTLHSNGGVDPIDQVLDNARHGSLQFSQHFIADVRDSSGLSPTFLLDSTLKHIELERYIHGFPCALRLPKDMVKSAVCITADDIDGGVSVGQGIKSALSRTSPLGFNASASLIHDSARRDFAYFNHPQLGLSSLPWRFEGESIVRRA